MTRYRELTELERNVLWQTGRRLEERVAGWLSLNGYDTSLTPKVVEDVYNSGIDLSECGADDLFDMFGCCYTNVIEGTDIATLLAEGK